METEESPEEERDGLSSNRSSAVSISTLTGGNLTSESSADLSKSPEHQQDNTDSKTPKQTHRKVEERASTSDSSTLSSSEEYQIAKVDIQEDDATSKSDTVGGLEFKRIESEGDGRGDDDDDDDDDGMEFDLKRGQHEEEEDRLSGLMSGSSIGRGLHNTGGFNQGTPVNQRRLVNKLASVGYSPNMNAIQQRQQFQPLAQKQRYTGNKQLARQLSGTIISENLSRNSSQLYNNEHQQQQQSGNHFEVRWRNLNLYARRSKIPKSIAENFIYKLLKNKTKLDDDDLEEVDNKTYYYSPPIKHKGNLQSQVTILPVSTISEELEMETGKQQQLGRVDEMVGHSAANQLSMDQWMNEQQSSAGPEYRCVLANISGSVFSGQLTAVLGPSGVGKTMLLNSLTGRNTLDGTGRVQLLGEASKRMAVVTVPQADILPGKLTVSEDLEFTSRIKNPQSNFDHKRNIGRIVQHLHMEKFINTRIDKLSGGEARRLSIGRELLSSPDIMILDEPTSGLDANTCKKIITSLRDIVEHSENYLDRPMSIIITIHQPQQEVLNLFHRAYVIALGGRAIYEGSPVDLLPTLLEQSSLSRVCKLEQLNDNPAIVALEVASGEYGPTIIAELALHHESQVIYDEDAISIMGGAYSSSPYSTPRQPLRSPRKSPISVSPHIDFLNRAHRRNLSDSPRIGSPRHTPIMAALANNKRAAIINASSSQMDRISNVTSVSYASTYDNDLPEPKSRLKVDKRLRRSVVMKSHFLSHTRTLMKRCWLLTTRDLFLLSIRIVGFILVAGGMVQIFRHALEPNENQCPAYQSEIDDIISYMGETKHRMLNLRNSIQQLSSTHLYFFHLILCLTMVVSALTGLVFPLQMRMFIREHNNGWYSPASFITSQTIAEFPIDILGPIITLVIVYPLTNQPESEYHWREAGYMIIVILSSIICKSVAQIVGAFMRNSVENSVFISCVMVTPSALLSGLAVRINTMPKPLQIISYGSFVRYTFESLFVIRYGYGICPCDHETINGYPIKTSFEAIPPQLDRLARGFMDLNTPITTTLMPSLLANSTELQPDSNNTQQQQQSPFLETNLFVRFIELVTDASNRFVPNASDMGDCTRYRSLALMDQGIDDYILPKYLLIMVFMFFVSRFLTYFVVRLVIRLNATK